MLSNTEIRVSSFSLRNQVNVGSAYICAGSGESVQELEVKHLLELAAKPFKGTRTAAAAAAAAAAVAAAAVAAAAAQQRHVNPQCNYTVGKGDLVWLFKATLRLFVS